MRKQTTRERVYLYYILSGGGGGECEGVKKVVNGLMTLIRWPIGATPGWRLSPLPLYFPFPNQLVTPICRVFPFGASVTN